MPRNRAYFRWQRQRIIQKKLALLKRLGGEDYVQAWTRGVPGKMAKGKIHCSCPMCRTKSYDQMCHRDARQVEMGVQQMLDSHSFYLRSGHRVKMKVRKVLLDKL